ncbi:yippee putative zinc-binding protein [Opisthorchis viverrini]|uniref:Protein yippee-like n=1 Tax=Opisthorchis viverrini TaxID=6198 RepID=A0A1S8XBD2_OPIVI|nr:yippee putative zinc-binding protein [Opisthorchis viverrini]
MSDNRGSECAVLYMWSLHSVADIYCDCCHTVLGWKYEQAYETSQKYKEGKYIIELAHLIKDNGWDLSWVELDQRRPY